MELALAYPYTLGVVAAFNPCGFAMLPAYLSYFVGTESDESDTNTLRNVSRALAVGVTLTAGFVAVFGLSGVLFETILSQAAVLDKTGYFTVAVGTLMIPMGIWLLLGHDINLRLPKMSRGTGSRDLASVFMFGVSYAVVSLSCTIGIFLAGVSGSFASDGFLDGVAFFLAYGLGMGSVITFLTISLALAKTNIARDLRRVLPYVGRVSGLVLMLAGAYLVNYGIWEIRVLDDPTIGNRAVEWFQTVQANIQNWIADTTAARLGLFSLFAIAGAVLLGWAQSTSDVIKRRSLVATYLGAYLVVEFGFNRGEFVAGPVARFVAGWPRRMINWFDDPLRAGVLAEFVFVVLVALMAFRKATARRPPAIASAEA